MDARYARFAFVAAALMLLGAGYRTTNFIINAPSLQLAREIGATAERFRRDLAIQWLGRELPRWQQPCPVSANVSPHHGAGGATSFMFQQGRPFGWQMTIQGSRQRILDSVLPHEVTHTIFATHFGRPLPRWADEGACTTVEHVSEKKKHDRMLTQFLTTGRGIAFNDMFAMKEYPRDFIPLYSQGYSLARFLIGQGGKRKFVDYVGEGLRTRNWPAATRSFYGSVLSIRTGNGPLSDLSETWLDWVRRGCPRLNGSLRDGVQLASNEQAQTDRSNWIYRGQSAESAVSSPPVRAALTTAESLDQRNAQGESWYARQTLHASTSANLTPQAEGRASPWSDSIHSLSIPQRSMLDVSMVRPQAPQPSRRVILEWSAKDLLRCAPATGLFSPG